MADEAVLWDLTDSPYCMKVRMVLQLKGVPYRRCTLTLRNRRALRRMSPACRVPVLVHRGRVVADSTAIARVLDVDVAEPPLLPPDAAARAFCELVEEWADESLGALVGACKWLNPANRREALARTVPELAGGVPRWLVARALVARVARRYRALGLGPGSMADVEARLAAQLDTLATLLDDRPFLLGRAPTLADLSVFAQLAWLRPYVEARLVDERATVARWCARLDAIPAIAAALPS